MSQDESNAARRTFLLQIVLNYGASGSMTARKLHELGQSLSGPGRPLFPKLRTVKDWLSDLEVKGVVQCRSDSYMLGRSLGVAVGVAVGPDVVRGGLVDANGNLCGTPVVSRSQGEWSLLQSPSQAAKGVDGVLKQLASRVSDMNVPAVVGVGVAFPAPIDRSYEVHASWLGQAWNRNRSELLRLSQTCVRKHLGDIPTEIINDANAEAVTFAFDQARAQAQAPASSEDAVLMTLHVGAGVGAGVIELGHFDPYDFSFRRSRLLLGAHGFSGELGHLRIAQHDIDELSRQPSYHLGSIEYGGCSCGAPSHLEGYVGTRALMRRLTTAEYAREDGTFESQWADLYQNQKAAVTECLGDIGILLGKAFASAIRLVDPAEIRLTGPLGVGAVKDGMKTQMSLWHDGVPHTVEISTGGSPLAEVSELVTVRGAGLSILRAHVYERLEEIVAQLM